MLATLPIDIETLRWERLEHLPVPRDVIARHVLAITALFAGDYEVAEQAAIGDLPCGDQPVHLVAEQLVRDLGPRAEGSTVQLTGRHPRTGDVLFEVLIDEELLDDYQRIVAATQHDAYEDPVTEAERDAHLGRLTALAREASASAAFMRDLRRSNARVCSCGRTYLAHTCDGYSRPSAQFGPRPCWSFRHVEDLRCSAVPDAVLPDAVRAWAAHNDVPLDQTAQERVLALLGELRTGGKGATTTLGQALPALVAAVAGPHT